MFFAQKFNCSLSLVATIVSIVALVSVVQLFLFPAVPSFDYFGYKQVKDSCIPVNGTIDTGKNNVFQSNQQPLNVQFPADLHKAVVYRGAPWRAEIGRWLSGCSSVATPIKVSEVLLKLHFIFMLAYGNRYLLIVVVLLIGN